jgi:asparagine synthase (glutamine-hydrolysing)
MESDVPLGALLSGGIDSSLISAVAQAATGGLLTFNVRFTDKEFDETWAAGAVAKHIGSHHVTLDMDSVPGSWDWISNMLLHAGQPFADTSLFAVNAVCRLIRQHVTVALSGDGGDEGFGGYELYWRIATIARFQQLPVLLRAAAPIAMKSLTTFGFFPQSYEERCSELVKADDISIIQSLFCWVRLCLDDHKALPVRRLFEPQWEHRLPRGTSRIERLSALGTETNVRLMLPNDFLFKVDTASMKESLEVRVPMLDEDLFAFGLSLPHCLKVKGRMCKRVLRGVAERRLPPAISRKPKGGFGIPMDSWVDAEFKVRLRDALLGPASRLPDFFRPEVYRPIVEAFCDGRQYQGVSREGLYRRVIMLLSVELTIANSALIHQIS